MEKSLKEQTDFKDQSANVIKTSQIQNTIITNI